MELRPRQVDEIDQFLRNVWPHAAHGLGRLAIAVTRHRRRRCIDWRSDCRYSCDRAVRTRAARDAVSEMAVRNKLQTACFTEGAQEGLSGQQDHLTTTENAV